MIWTDLDTWIIIAGILTAVSCSLLGNFMVLRKLSMMGDAISHAVLPGLAIAFLVTNSRNSLTMFIGAAIVGVLTAVFTHSIHSVGKVEEGASLGVVFTTLFALGLILLVRAADSVDLDPGCVLYGAIELTPLDTIVFMNQEIPKAVITLSIVLIVNLVFVILFFKELRISAFDPGLATTMGINAQVMHYALMTLVAMTTVACFESVGSILVIAMLIVPAATAHLLTDRLHIMVGLSAALAAVAAVLGHVSAITLPRLWGFADTSTAGMMAVASGIIFFFVMLLAPRYGIISKGLHQILLGIKITCEDILSLLFRMNEINLKEKGTRIPELLKEYNGTSYFLFKLAIIRLKNQGKITFQNHEYQLTDSGITAARSLIRSHRLWESYLFKYSNLAVDHLHFSAHQLEHVTDSNLQQLLENKIDSSKVDPHGKNIPDQGTES